MNLPPYGDALQRSDLKRYPTDVERIPQRGAAGAVTPQPASSFSEVAAQVEAEQWDPPATSETVAAKPAKPFALWQNGDFGFGDFLDIVNPLQHIPIVATLYRHMTGDAIGAAPRVIGGALWGRLGGFISGVLNAVVDWFTGKDIGDHIYAALFGDKTETNENTLIAHTREATVNSPMVPAAAREEITVPFQPVLEPFSRSDPSEQPLQKSDKEPLPLSSVPPVFDSDLMGQALLSSYLRGRQHADSDEDPRRFHVKV
jgi:hypothetical protein